MSTEVVVGPVADPEHRVPHTLELRCIRRLQALPELGTVVRWPAVAERTGHEDDLTGRRKVLQRSVVHRDQPGTRQPPGQLRGELLGRPGLGCPQHHRSTVGRRCRRVDRPRVRSREQPVHPQPDRRPHRSRRWEHRHSRRTCVHTCEKAGQVTGLVLVEFRRRRGQAQRRQSPVCGRPVHRDRPQPHRTDLEFGLQRIGVDGIVGQGVDGEVLTVFVVPVERHPDVAGLHAVGDHHGQHGAPAARRELNLMLLGDPLRSSVFGVYLHERRTVELVELVHLPGLGHGVPLMLQTAGVEHHRVVVIGQFPCVHVRAGEELRPPRRCGEGQPGLTAVLVDVQRLGHSVVQVADGVAVGTVIGRAGPLQRGLTKALVAGATQVITGARVRETADLVEDLRAGLVGEIVTETEVLSDAADQFPVRAGVPDRGYRLLQQRQIPLGVDHHGVRLGPQRGGQHDVCVAVGGRIAVGILGDDQFGGLQSGDDGGPVGHRGNRIRADDPAGLDLAGRGLLEHRDGARPDIGADGAGVQTPLLLAEGPVLRREHRTLARQSRPHVTHFAAAHRVGLAGQRHRSAAGPADGTGRQMQVADRVGVPGAVRALVESHGPAGHPLPGLGDHRRGGADVGLGDPGDRSDPVRRIVGQEGRHGVPALGVLGDELLVDVAALNQQVQQTVEQGQIRAGFDRQIEVGPVGGGGAPRIDDDEFRAGLEPIGHSQEQDRMAVGHIRADDEEQIGGIEIGVRTGRPIGAQGLLVTGSRAGHAQPGVRLDVHGAQVTLGQLGRQILGLDRHLARHIQRHGIGAVFVDDGPQPAAGFGDRGLHRRRLGLLAPRAAHQCRREPVVGGGHHLGVRGALGAQPAEVGGMQLVAADLGDDGKSRARRRRGGHLDAATDTTVRARGARRLPCGNCHTTIVRGHCSGSFEPTLS